MSNLLAAARDIWMGRETESAITFLLEGGAATFSFGDLMLAAQASAGELSARGVGAGDIVILMLRHRPELASVFLGAMWIGAIPSFMPPPTEKQNPDYFWSSHAELFQRIEARLLATDLAGEVEHGERLREFQLPVWDVEQEPPAARGNATRYEADDDTIAFLQHSSGTTALKKGVALSHRAVLAQIAAYGPCIGIGPGRTVVSWLPLYHDMGLIAAFILPLMTGAHTVMMCPFRWVREPWLLLDAIEQWNGDFVWMPNFAFNLLAITRPDDRRWRLDGVRAFINCSEPCKADTFERFAAAFADCGVRPGQLQVSYAMAETVFAVTQTPVGHRVEPLVVDAEAFLERGAVLPRREGQATLAFLPVGPAIPGMRAQIVDGEIAVSGECLFDGYYRLPEATARSRRGDWHLTGDLGFLCHENLYVTGRKSDVIIVRGRKYHGFDIEHVAGGVPGVKPGRAVAIAVENVEMGTEDAILIAETDVAENGIRTTVKRAVFDQLGLILADVYLVPPRWIAKTTSGKISRALNTEKYLKERHGRA